MKFSTPSTLCQELFSSLFKLFCSVIRIVFSCARCLADSLVILSRPFPFVNGFFQVFSSFSPFWQFCPAVTFRDRRAMCVLVKGSHHRFLLSPFPSIIYLLNTLHTSTTYARLPAPSNLWPVYLQYPFRQPTFEIISFFCLSILFIHHFPAFSSRISVFIYASHEK